MTKDRRHLNPGRAILALLIVSTLLLLSACAQLERLKPQPEAPEVVETPPKKPEPPPEPPPPKRNALYQWYGDGRAVSRIEIDVDQQKAVFYDGPHEIGWTRVASGVRSYPTPTGSFAITEKVAEKRSNIYGKIYNSKGKVVKTNATLGVHRIPAGGRFEGAKMPYFMRLTNDGIGMHAGPIPRPGRPASHGCIRMPHALAPVLYKHVGIGTPVSIVGSGPSYGKYLASQRRNKPEGAPAPGTASPTTKVASAAAVGNIPDTTSESTSTVAGTNSGAAAAQIETAGAAQTTPEENTSTPEMTSPAETGPDVTAPELSVATSARPDPVGHAQTQPAAAEIPTPPEAAVAVPETGMAGAPAAAPAPTPATASPPVPTAESHLAAPPAGAKGSTSTGASADSVPAAAPAATPRTEG